MEARRISAQEVKKRMEKGDHFVFIDARNPKAWGIFRYSTARRQANSCERNRAAPARDTNRPSDYHLLHVTGGGFKCPCGTGD